MCGILAGYHASGFVEQRLENALKTMHHRGPDGKKLWLSEDKTTALGHTRLAIVDREHGSQPLWNETGTIAVVANGEFYEHETVRKQLEAKGHLFSTKSDSEILIHLYEEYGVECLQYLRGEFAFVLWDAAQQLFFAARDRFGIKPLCYSQNFKNIYFASEAKALFATGVPARFSLDAWRQVLHFQYISLWQTYFEDIFQVPPGHYAIYRAPNNSLQLQSYWDISWPCEIETRPLSSARELIEECRFRVEDAVRIRLRSEVPVGVYLSGGIDSAAVLGIASREVSSLQCVSVALVGEGYDERVLAKEMAASVGARCTLLEATAEGMFEALSDAVYYSEGLAINGHLPAKYMLSRLARSLGLGVILSGEGSDELFAGYPHLRQDILLAEQQSSLVSSLYTSNVASAGIQLPAGERFSLQAVQEALGYIPTFLQAKASLGTKLHALCERDVEVERVWASMGGLLQEGQLRGRHVVRQSMYLWSKLSLAGYILRTLGDGTEMAHSIEGRTPFLDHKLWEFARQIPMGLLIENGVEKSILRKAISGYVIPKIATRQKHPFLAPPVLVQLRERLLSARFAALPWVSATKVEDLLQRLPRMHASEQATWEPVLFLLLSASLLQERLVCKNISHV